MPTYTKLFNSILASTIWSEDDKTRIVWITMLAMADQNGEIHASIPGLARMAGVDVENTRRAVSVLLSPDPDSRTPDNEGRRITPIDGGWELLNHGKYRKMASKEDEKAANAARVRRHRARNAGNGDVTPCNGDVMENGDIADTDTDTKADTDNKNTVPPNPLKGEWDIFPSGSLRKSKTDQKRIKVIRNNDKMIYIGKLFDRKPETLWTVAEAKALMDVDPPRQEVEKITAYRRLPLECHRRDIITLLNNWSTELDRASLALPSSPSSTPTPKPAEPEGWRDAASTLFPHLKKSATWALLGEENRQLVMGEMNK